MSQALSVLCIKFVELDFGENNKLLKQMRVESARLDLTHNCEAKVDSKLMRSVESKTVKINLDQRR